MGASIHSPQPPLQRGLGGMDCRTHSTLISDSEWVLNDEKTVKWGWNEEEKNLRGWPLFKKFPRPSAFPSFKIEFIQSKVTIFWSLVGGIWFFSFFLIKNEGMKPEWEWKIEVTQKYLSFFSHSIIPSSFVPLLMHHFTLIQWVGWVWNECVNPFPPTPSAEGVGGIGLSHTFYSHPRYWMSIEWVGWVWNECVNPFPPTPSAEGVGGIGLSHSF